jgi:hypothetical protein
LAELHLNSRLDAKVKVLLLRDNNLRAQETARQTFIMVRGIDSDVARMMKARVTLVAVY